MTQPRKPSIVKVSNHSSHRSLDRKHKHPSIRKRSLNNVIHVTVGLRKEVRSTKNLHSSKKYTKKTDSMTNKSTSQIRGSTKTSRLTRSPRVAHHEDVLDDYNEGNKHDYSDRTDVTNDYHQKTKLNKKKKCSRRCFIASLLATLLVVLVIAAILLALLIKPKSVSKPNTIPVLRWNTTGITVAGITSNPGNASNQLAAPLDVILDYANNLSIGKTLIGNGTAGSSQGLLKDPSRVIMDTNGDFYISEYSNHRIQFWGSGATSGKTVAGITNSSGNASNQLFFPYGIALNPTSGTLYIADCYNHRIMSYASGVNNGTLVLGGIGGGITNTQLYNPVGLYFDSFSNSLVIANYAANNIVRYVLGASSWTIVAGDAGGSPGITSTYFTGPIDMTFDPMGNMYVVDKDNYRIQFFNAGQLNGSTIAGITGVNSNTATTLDEPWSVKLDSQLNLYVVDMLNSRIQKFLRY